MAEQLEPDLIVLDFAMPMLNGMQAAEEILKFTPTVPIVLFTLYESSQLELEATRVGIRKVIWMSDAGNTLMTALARGIGRSGPSPSDPLGLTEEHPAELLPVPGSIVNLQPKVPGKPDVAEG